MYIGLVFSLGTVNIVIELFIPTWDMPYLM